MGVPNVYWCIYCPKTFTQSNALDIHYKAHEVQDQIAQKPIERNLDISSAVLNQVRGRAT